MDNYENRYKGVKGWLLLLCINLTILDPGSIFFNLIVVTNLAKPYFDTYQGLFRLIIINGICSIGLMVFSIYAGMSLWRLSANAVNIAKKYLMSVFFYSALAVFLPDLLGIPEKAYSKFAGNTLLNSIVTMCYVTIWYIYLNRSKRVRATFGETQQV